MADSRAWRSSYRRGGGDGCGHVVVGATITIVAAPVETETWLESPAPTRFREAGGRIDAGRIPKVKPIFSAIVNDDAGHLWVRLVTHGSSVVFDVFDPEGRYLGAVDGGRAMTSITPVIRGDRFYAVVRDSLDIPYVVRYRIVGRNRLD